ncbi:YheC/YheD family protein [Metabacillus idriensis]|uniref:YheC/YheD family endospore coat-associated protein n=1 Tax=Metabacillus idriensis TaxID=324768 RepID=UPI002813F61E|nr:YheC/YheD family protein [Metabacillus idriensis]MDR0136289.1 YheC/YheD family protein [Metabacillus idriensis]
MNPSYSITAIFSEAKKLILPASVRHETNEMITEVVFGTAASPCFVEFQELNGAIKISKDLMDQLRLPLGKTQLILHQNSVYLGPLIGIFTAGFTGSILRPIGNRSLFFAKYLTAQKAAGLFAYVFGAHLIDWETGIVNGYTFDDDGWRQMKIPLPNVVYDRLPNRETEDHHAMKMVKKRLKTEYGIPWFNPGFFDKWTIHELLLPHAEAAVYLPETMLDPSYEQIEKMLRCHRSVYLKPRNGSLGLGVFQLIYEPDEHIYYCRYRSQEDNILRKYKSLDQFFKFSFGSRKMEDYLLQERIKLIRIEHQQVDFRVHTNKDSMGRFHVTAIAAKIAGKGSVTTHVDNGGIVKTLEELFDQKDERNQAFRSLTSAALVLSEKIDQCIEGFIGEIGFDFGIDDCGNVWLFEANSKPGRSIFSHPSLKEEDLHSRKLSLQYALYLFKIAIEEPEVLYK